MTTIGYGDISPKETDTKILCLFQQLTVLFQIANFLSKVVTKKPFQIKFKKNQEQLPTISGRLGRQRRYNSCQMDYSSGTDIFKSMRRRSRGSMNKKMMENNRINIEEDNDEIRITLPVPPTTFNF